MSAVRPSFAADPGTHEYYDRRAEEYDEWYLGEGRFTERVRPGWHDELARLVGLLSSLEALPTVDVACGTAFLSRHLPGPVLGIDRSAAMLQIARGRIGATALADALALPVATRSVARVFTGHFYGHHPPDERVRFLEEVRRVAGELVVVDTALRPGEPEETWQERVLNDGSSHRVFKRFLPASRLAREVGGSVLFEGRWFVGARALLAATR